jgi:hypothetical protein
MGVRKIALQPAESEALEVCWAELGYWAAGANSPRPSPLRWRRSEDKLGPENHDEYAALGSAFELKNKEHFRAKKPREATPEQTVLASFLFKT